MNIEHFLIGELSGDLVGCYPPMLGPDLYQLIENFSVYSSGTSWKRWSPDWFALTNRRRHGIHTREHPTTIIMSRTYFHALLGSKEHNV